MWPLPQWAQLVFSWPKFKIVKISFSYLDHTLCIVISKLSLIDNEIYITRNSGRFAPFFLAPAVGRGPFRPPAHILSEAADQDGRFDTLISSLGQLVVELLIFVFKLFSNETSERTYKHTDECTPNLI